MFQDLRGEEMCGIPVLLPRFENSDLGHPSFRDDGCSRHLQNGSIAGSPNDPRNELGSPRFNAEEVNRLRAIVKVGDSHDLAQA